MKTFLIALVLAGHEVGGNSQILSNGEYLVLEENTEVPYSSQHLSMGRNSAEVIRQHTGYH